MAAAVPVYRSLLVRLLAASIVIAGCAIAATAWIAASTATSALVREQGQTLEADNDIVSQLSGYAVAHTELDRRRALAGSRFPTLPTAHRAVAADGKTISDTARSRRRRRSRRAPRPRSIR